MNKAVIGISLACIIATALVMAYQGVIPSLSPGKSHQRIVVVDMLRLEIAQQKQVNSFLGEKPTSSDFSAAFRAAGDVRKAAEEIAPNSHIMIKQAMLHSDAPDITGQIIDHLGLPATSSKESTPRHFIDKNSEPPQRTQEDAAEIRELIKNRRKSTMDPYGE